MGPMIDIGTTDMSVEFGKEKSVSLKGTISAMDERKNHN